MNRGMPELIEKYGGKEYVPAKEVELLEAKAMRAIDNLVKGEASDMDEMKPVFTRIMGEAFHQGMPT